MAEKSLAELLDQAKGDAPEGDDQEADKAEEKDAGEALAEAVKSGDGNAIYEAFETLNALCKEREEEGEGEYGEEEEEGEGEKPEAGHGKGLMLLLGAPHKGA